MGCAFSSESDADRRYRRKQQYQYNSNNKSSHQNQLTPQYNHSPRKQQQQGPAGGQLPNSNNISSRPAQTATVNSRRGGANNRRLSSASMGSPMKEVATPKRDNMSPNNSNSKATPAVSSPNDEDIHFRRQHFDRNSVLRHSKKRAKKGAASPYAAKNNNTSASTATNGQPAAHTTSPGPSSPVKAEAEKMTSSDKLDRSGSPSKIDPRSSSFAPMAAADFEHTARSRTPARGHSQRTIVEVRGGATKAGGNVSNQEQLKNVDVILTSDIAASPQYDTGRYNSSAITNHTTTFSVNDNITSNTTHRNYSRQSSNLSQSSTYDHQHRQQRATTPTSRTSNQRLTSTAATTSSEIVSQHLRNGRESSLGRNIKKNEDENIETEEDCGRLI